MAASYLVDGYNLLFAMGLFDRHAGAQALQQARDLLLRYLHDALGTENCDIEVIFDSPRPKATRPVEVFPGLRVQYAHRGEVADDVIEELIDRCPSPQQLVVISNDHRIREAARRKGAHAWSSDDFLDHSEGRRAASIPAGPCREERRGPPTREEVNHWLSQFGDVADDPDFRQLFERFGFDDSQRD